MHPAPVKIPLLLAVIMLACVDDALFVVAGLGSGFEVALFWALVCMFVENRKAIISQI